MKKLLLIGIFLAAPLVAFAGYGQGGYYSQGSYYSQSYYQTYYQGGYTAQQIVNMRSTVDQCGHANNPSLLTCNNFSDWANPPNTLGTYLVPATAGAFVFRATSGGNATALSSFCRAWGKMGSSGAAWQPQMCVDGPSGGSLPSISAGQQVTLEFWNRARANIGYWNSCSWVCGDHMDWYLQNWLPNCSTNYGVGASGALTTLSGQTAQGYSGVNVFPLVTTTYTVNCSGGDPGNLSRSITVTVLAAPTMSFSVSSPANYNTASTVNWSTTLVHACTISGGNFGGGTPVGTSGVNGSTGLQTTSSILYTLSCLRDSDNSVMSQGQTVSVDQCANVVGTQSGAPANGTMSSGTCSCNSGFVLSGASCLPQQLASVSPTDSSANEPSDTGTFTFSRADTSTAFTVNYTVTGTAITSSPAISGNPANYTSIGTSLSIPVSSASATKTVTPIDDATNETTGTVIINVTSASKAVNDGTLVGGPSLVAGKIAEAVSLNGSAQYVQVRSTDLGVVNQHYTLSAWVRLNAGSAGIAMHTSTVADGTGWCVGMLGVSGGKPYIASYNGVAVVATGATTVTTGVWHLITGTYDGTNLNIYYDGVLEASTPQTSYAASGANNYVNIGGSNAACIGANGYWNGSIDDARIYNRALSAGEVSSLNSLGTVSGNASGYWTMNSADTSGATEFDRGGTLNIGSPSNATITLNDNDTTPTGTITGGVNGLKVVCAVGQTPASTCRIRSGSTATISWTVTDMVSCGVTGSDGTTPAAQSGANATNGAHSVSSSAVNNITVFTLLCTDGLGAQSRSEARVQVIPIVKEN